jgi:hypothetical protein
MKTSAVIWVLILASSPLANAANLAANPAANLRVQEGRPIVDGVFVNGHGPYRFLIDTGTNVNLIDANLARSIGMNATFEVDLASATGKTPTPGSDENEVVLETAKANGQEFLFSRLEAVHSFSHDIQGVLGQWFLSQFDYTLDLQAKRLVFGKQDRSGQRVPLRMINGRLAVSTNLGDLIVDSGAARVALFGVEAVIGPGGNGEWRTLAGSQAVGFVSRSLVIEGRTIWRGDAVAIHTRSEPGVDGLLPLSLFKAIYVCNSEGYVMFE